MMRKTRFGIIGALLALSCVANWAGASEGEDIKLDHAPIDRFDNASIQRGARLFVNNCLSCHSAQFMRYSSLRALGLDDVQIQKNLQVTGNQVTDFMKIAMDTQDAKNWFGAPPPDLTLVARSRGVDWLYGYLRAFYRDPSRPTGWNNLVFHNVGMPHVLWEHSGQGILGSQKFESLEEARGEALRISGPTKIKTEHGHDGVPDQYIVEQVLWPQSGAHNAEEYTREVTDLVNYLAFMAEPGYLGHRQVGRFAIIGLALAVFAAYIVKREYWKDIH